MISWRDVRCLRRPMLSCVIGCHVCFFGIAAAPVVRMAVGTENDALGRLRMDAPGGSLVIFDAAAPDGVAGTNHGFTAWWRDDQSSRIFVYNRLLYSTDDARAAATALRRDLGAEVTWPAEPDGGATVPSMAADDEISPRLSWILADRGLVFDVMGFDGPLPPEPEGPSPISVGCAIPLGVLMTGPVPFDEILRSLPLPTTPDDVIDSMALAMGCGGPGHGDPPPCPGDKDCDGIPDGSDWDVDGDGIPNGEDGDVDGDGTPNGSDDDVDGDGISNGSDSDVDGDGIPNGGDNDIDGDGIGNASDPDIDGDGTPNGSDGDADGDGIPNGSDPEPNGCTTDCPGACCTKATGACASKKESECTGDTVYFKGKEVPCDPNPCCAFGTNNPFNPQSASAYEVEPTWTWNERQCSYGLTRAERITSDNITISAACNGTQWCAVMLTLNAQYSQGWRLFPGQQEVYGPGNNTTADNFCPQVTELEALGFYPPACTAAPPYATWYMLEAVRQHELVHSGSLQQALQAIAPGVETTIEALCVPQPGKTRNDAIAEIRALPGFSAAVGRADTDWLRQWQLNPDQDPPGGLEDQAEHAVVDPRINWICGYSFTQCWTYCSACPQRPTGACCAGGGTGLCSVKTQWKCECDGGQYRSDGETCGPPNPCVGACCLSETQCTEVSYTRCVSGLGGIYHGDATTCTPNLCLPHP